MKKDILHPETYQFQIADAGWLLLVRHGETTWNASRRIQGATDIPLNDTGLAQARLLAERFRNLPCSAIYSSDMQRAKDTAAPISKALGLDIHIDSRLRERDCGILEGCTWEDILALDPDRPPNKAMDLDRYERVEKLAPFKERVRSATRDIVERHFGELVVVVTHGAVLSAFFEDISNGEIPIGSKRIVNASISLAGRTEKEWHIPLVNETTHLEESDCTNAGAASSGA